MDIVCHLHAPNIGANRSAPPMVASGPKRQFLRRNHTSEVGGEADTPRQLDRRVLPEGDLAHLRTRATGEISRVR